MAGGYVHRYMKQLIISAHRQKAERKGCCIHLLSPFYTFRDSDLENSPAHIYGRSSHFNQHNHDNPKQAYPKPCPFADFRVCLLDNQY